jgi:DNA topoisomerase VI subunit A
MVLPHQRRLGSITGPITLHDEEGSHDLRASAWSGPRDGSGGGISVVEHDAQSMLLVEKNTIFARLRDDDFATKNHCVLCCGTGFPGRSFRALVGQLHQQLQLPFHVLADNDPAGYQLFFLTAREFPAAAYLGLRVRDYELLGLPDWVQIALTDAEREQLRGLKARPWLKSDVAWQLELDGLLQRGFKVEMEALCTVSVSCFADCYLPERLAAKDHLRSPVVRREA